MGIPSHSTSNMVNVPTSKSNKSHKRPIARKLSSEDNTPIHVVLETEPPMRKPGRPRLGISSNFQDTGEMANNSHRLVWCIGCIKSGKPMYMKDRLPARGDLMQRHLQTCPNVSEEVRYRFCKGKRSNSAASSMVQSQGISTKTTPPQQTRPPSSAQHEMSMPIISTNNYSIVHINEQPPLASPSPQPRLGLGLPLPLLQFPRNNSTQSIRTASFAETQLPRIRSPDDNPRSTSPIELPSISHRHHPYLRNNRSNRASPARYPHQMGRIQLPPLVLPVPNTSVTNRSISISSPPHNPKSLTGNPLPPTGLRRKLQVGAEAVGIRLTIESPVTANMIARLGYDWAAIDVGINDQLGAMVTAVMDSCGCTPLVRIPLDMVNDKNIGRIVDAGAQGIMVSGIRHRDDVSYLMGILSHHRSSLLVVPEIISDQEIVESLSDILAVPGIDAMFLDIPSKDAGIGRRKSGSESPLGETIARALEIAHRMAVPMGIESMDGFGARRRVRQGFQLVTTGSDVEHLEVAASDHLRMAQAS